MKDASILRTLQNIGFDEKEAAVYMALLELGQAPVSEVAERAELKRAIVYHVIERLKQKGYAQDVKSGKVKHFAVSDPSKLLQHASSAIEDLKFMLPLMRSLQDKGRSKPRIEYFEGKNAVFATYQLYEQSKMGRYITSLDRLHQIFPQELKAWIERCRSGIVPPKAHHLITDTTIDKKWGKDMMKYGQHVRCLPKDMQMDMDFAIMDRLIGITSFDPLFIVVIHSEAIATSAAQLFDMAWGQGRKVQ